MIEDIAYLGLLDDEEIMLDVAALDLAALDHPGTELGRYHALLDEMLDRLLDRGRDARSARERADALSEVIAGEYRFHGDRETYDDPANADLIAVIDRRLGLPVSLSILYVAQARRIGWDAHALSTPGHVLVRIDGDPSPLLIDPFGGGAVVGALQLASLLSSVLGAGTAAGPEHVAPMTNREALVRLLMNQATRAEQAGEVDRALTIYGRMTTVSPACGHAWWERARLELVQGDVGSAKASLNAMLEMTRDPELRLHIFAALDALAR